MVGDSSGSGCRLLKKAKAGRGLAGIEHLAVRSFGKGAELVGQCGDSREALEEIQSYSFAFEQGSGATGHVGYAVSFLHVISVIVEDFEMVYPSSDIVNRLEEFGSGQNHILSGQEVSRSSTVFRHARLGSYVSGAYVFVKSQADNVNELRGH
jgi:hypothetical protein